MRWIHRFHPIFWFVVGTTVLWPSASVAAGVPVEPATPEQKRQANAAFVRFGDATLTVAAAGRPWFVHVNAVGVDPRFYVVDLESYWAAPSQDVVVQEEAKESSEYKAFFGLHVRNWSYVAGGVGVAGAVTYGVFGAMNLAKHSKIADNCSNMLSPAGSDYSGDVDAGRRNKHIANVGFVVGTVGFAAGGTLFVLSTDSEQDTAKTTTFAQVAICPG